MKGFEFDPVTGRITIVNGSRVVATSDGTLVNLLTSEHDFGDTTVTFADVPKSWWYHFHWTEATNAFADNVTNAAEAYITATPAEQSSKTTLMAAPAGADIFVGLVKLHRTVAPSSTWWGHSIAAGACVNNEWMLWDGSALVEQAEGMARAIHVYIDSSHNLVIEQQYSMADAINDDNWGSFGSAAPAWDQNRSGHTDTFGTKGFPILLNDTKSNAHSYNNASPPLYTGWNDCAKGNSNQASVTDATNYSSTFVVSVKGFFGRRS